MQRVAFLQLLLSGTLVTASRLLHRSQGRLAVVAKEHPVEGTINLLKELSDKSLKNSQEEEHVYGKFDKWCKDSDKSLSKAIAAGKQKIDSLKDKVSSLEKEQKSLENSIEKLENEILEHEGASKNATDARDEENGLWKETDTDLESTIDAISQALVALKGAETETTGLLQAKVAKLLQVPTLLAQLTSRQQELLFGTAGTDTTTTKPDLMSKGDLAKHQKVYEFKGGSVIELLKSLQAKFEDDRVESTKAETNAQNAFLLTEDARAKAIETADSAKKEKESILGEVKSDLSEDKLALKGCVDDLDVDETSLSDTQESCKLKASEYATRVELQQGEQEAIAKAIEILSKVTGVRTEQPTNPVPPTSPLLLQMPPKEQASPRRQKALVVLRKAAHQSHSQEFADLVAQVAAAADGPFEQVNDMMQKMIYRLMDEQKDEDEHKLWCDKELEKVNISTENKEEKIETLESKIKDGDAKVGDLSEDIKDADEFVATLEEHMEEATEVRAAGKAENKAAIKDAQDAQTAIAQAIAVLEQYYKDAGGVPKEDWEFLQRHREPVTVPDSPKTWDASYTGIADPKNPDGILSMLEEVAADFSKMESNTRGSEQTDQKAYEEEIKDCKIEKAERMKESEMKTDEKKRLLDKIAALEKTLKHTSNELEMVGQYLKDLEPACLDGDSSYEDRKEAREAEVEALKEAQVILEEAFNEEETSGSPDPDSSGSPNPDFLQVEDEHEQPLHYPNGLRTRIARQMSELDAKRLRAANVEKVLAAQRAAEAAASEHAAPSSDGTADNSTQHLKTVLLSPHAGYWSQGIRERIARELAGADGGVQKEASAPAAVTPAMRGPVSPPSVPVVDAAINSTNSSAGSSTHTIASLLSSFFTRFTR